ncbi:MAG: hypothetical protein P8N92_07775, partial [Burkholderiales bacterium]|nr:hypothetical protein [Burkholderiales bacterium]
MKNICLSSFSINPNLDRKLCLAGPWCVNPVTAKYLSKSEGDFEILSSRTVSGEQFKAESEECMRLYEKYTELLANELNRVHGT